MVWVSTLGVEIDDALLEELRRRANQCRQRCYDAHRTCDANCSVEWTAISSTGHV